MPPRVRRPALQLKVRDVYRTPTGRDAAVCPIDVCMSSLLVGWPVVPIITEAESVARAGYTGRLGTVEKARDLQVVEGA